MKKAKIDNITLHDLRRTFAVQLIAKGVDIYQVSKLLRHEDVSTTQKYYADVIDRDQEEAVKKLEVLFWPAFKMKQEPGDFSGLFLYPIA